MNGMHRRSSCPPNHFLGHETDGGDIAKVVIALAAHPFNMIVGHFVDSRLSQFSAPWSADSAGSGGSARWPACPASENPSARTLGSRIGEELAA
jgi:hypothetical protein